MKNKKTLKLLLRISISIIIISLLLHNADVVDTIGAIAKSNHQIWVIGVALYVFGQLISAYKWQLISQTAGFQKKLKEYIDYYFVGMFFNLFLPTTVGGDIAKCYYLSKGDARDRKAPAVYTVLTERYTGVAVVVWMGAIAMFMPLGNVVPIGFKLFMLGLALFILGFTPIFPGFCLNFFKKYKWMRTMLRDVRVYWKNPKLIFKALCWSLIFHFLIVGIHIIIGNAMGLNIPVGYYFIVYPMTAMAGFIPLAFNGIGPREGTYIFFLSLIGIKSSAALAFGIFWFGIVLCSSLIGGIFYIKGKHTPPPEEFELDNEDEIIEGEICPQEPCCKEKDELIVH